MPAITYIPDDNRGRQRTVLVPAADVVDWIARREARGERIERIEFSDTERAGIVLAGSDRAADPLTELHLLRSDLAMARVVEDLLAALEDKGVIKRDDLPAEARAKIAQREQMRQVLTP